MGELHINGNNTEQAAAEVANMISSQRHEASKNHVSPEKLNDAVANKIRQDIMQIQSVDTYKNFANQLVQDSPDNIEVEMSKDGTKVEAIILRDPFSTHHDAKRITGGGVTPFKVEAEKEP